MSTLVNRLFYKIDFLRNREGYNWTDAEIARKLHLSPASYSKMKAGGRRITMPILMQLAEIFNVPLWYLLSIEMDLSSLLLNEKIGDYVQHTDLTYAKLAEIVELNILRVIELSHGAMPSFAELRKFNKVMNLNLSEYLVTDNRVLLIKLIMEKLEVEESKINEIMEYIEQR